MDFEGHGHQLGDGGGRATLVIGLGGAGARLAPRIAGSLGGRPPLLISNDPRDLEGAPSPDDSVLVDTSPVANPSHHAIRGFAMASPSSKELERRIAGRRHDVGTVVMVANLAGRAGSAIAPVVSSICKKAGMAPISFAIMPFGYEKDRLFASGVSLKRVKADSACTIVVDNDGMLSSNPDLTVRECFGIADSAITYIAGSAGSGLVPDEAQVLLSTGRRGGKTDMEDSLRDSLKMLYEGAPPNGVKRSIIHVLGGDNIPVGMMNAVAGLARGAFGESASVGTMSATADSQAESGIVMLSAVQGRTKFDGYDPLGRIPAENTLDWDVPDCSYDCGLGGSTYQMERD